MAALVLLGPQRHRITVGETLSSLGLNGRFAVITAGWQEREGEIEELDSHLGQEAVNLMLHQRVDAIFDEDRPFREAHRLHQKRIVKLQGLYRLRLARAMGAVRKLIESRDRVEPELLDPEIEQALDMVRALDDHHLSRIGQLREDFNTEWDPESRTPILDHRYELAEILESCEAVMIAGGHVAVLLNRLRLLGMEQFLAQKPILAWSAGAMVLGRRIVLFHDTPPQGQGYAEVMDHGLNLYGGLLPLPHAKNRLLLDNPVRVSLLARRFSDSICVPMETGSRLDWEHDRWVPKVPMEQLEIDGTIKEMAAP